MKKHLYIALIVIAVLAYFTQPYWTHETKQVTVVGALVKQYGDKSKYIVFTDAGTYENTDTWYYFKFNSSDIQGRLMRPGKYKITSTGLRIPFTSSYKNILSAEAVQ